MRASDLILAREGLLEGSSLDRFPRGMSETGDMQPALQAAIDSLVASGSTFGRLRLPEGEFTINSQITVPAGFGLALHGMGAGSRIVKDGNFSAFEWGGDPRGTPTDLTADVAIGDTVLTVEDTSDFTRFQWCELRSDKVFLNQNYEGERVKIRSVDSATQVTLEGPIMFDYVAADSPRLIPMTFAEGVEVCNLKIVNPNPGTDLVANALRVRGAYAPVFENFSTDGIDDTSLWIWDSPKATVRNPLFENQTNDIPAGRSGYGLLAHGASDHMQVIGGSIIGGRHFITTGSEIGEVGVRYVDVIGATGIMTSRAPFDSHGGARYIRFIGCKASQVRNGSGGFSHRSPDCAVIDCEVDLCEGGIGFSGGVSNHAHRGLVQNCTLRNILGGPGVHFSGVDDCVIDGLVIDGVLSDGMEGVTVGKDTETETTDSNRCRVLNYTARNIGTAAQRGDALAFAAGEGHSFDNLSVDTANAAIQVQEECTNFYGGKIAYARNVAAIMRSNVPGSMAGPMTWTGEGDPNGEYRAPAGTIYLRSDGDYRTMRYRKTTAHASNTGWMPDNKDPIGIPYTSGYTNATGTTVDLAYFSSVVEPVLLTTLGAVFDPGTFKNEFEITGTFDVDWVCQAMLYNGTVDPPAGSWQLELHELTQTAGATGVTVARKTPLAALASALVPITARGTPVIVDLGTVTLDSTKKYGVWIVRKQVTETAALCRIASTVFLRPDSLA